MVEAERKKMTPLERLRHSASHIMADAVQRIFPAAKLTIGPPVEDGFYYDFDYERGFTPEDLEKIEAVMKEIIAEKLVFESRTISKAEARLIFEKRNEPYKLEIIDDIEGDTVSMYRHGNWEDLCAGPHVSNTGKVKAVKLLKVAGAYWRGEETNKQLQRIYGTAFPSEAKLQEHLANLEAAKQRDHRRLGKELDLFSTMEESGAGLVLWHPMGGRVRMVMEDFWRAEHVKKGYEIVYTPHIAKLDLWKKSGHWEFYRENMYSPMEIDQVEYELKPMNCPFHIEIYKTSMRSYRELPMRMAELGTVYRYERSGVLHGITRVRGFTQDDAHIFCGPEQLEEEVKNALEFCLHILKSFGFNDFDIYLSTRPKKSVGTDEEWELAQNSLEQALQKAKVNFSMDEGEGVFYGPKIDIKIKDSLNRSWQCSTIQVDFNLPERYELEFINRKGEKQRPIMVHRALMGSLERFFGVMVEHYAGAFPVWLAPVQATIMTIAEAHGDFAMQVKAKLEQEGLRVELDDRNEKLGFKIREAQMKKVPYMLIIGDKEMQADSVAVRSRQDGDQGVQTVEDFMARILCEVKEKQ